MSEETDKMKDLLIKLQILTNGLVEERKKSKNYLEKIKELEKMLKPILDLNIPINTLINEFERLNELEDKMEIEKLKSKK